MKKIILLFSLFILCYNSFAQIRIGDTFPGFYHATYVPAYKIQDTIYDYVLESKGDIIAIDVDGDGVNDLSLISNYYENTASHNTRYPFWNCEMRLNSLTEAILLPGNKADTLHINDAINNSNNWSNQNAFFCFNINNYTVDSTWKDKNTCYVGLRVRKATGDTLYGWMSIAVKNYNIIYLKEYACQSLNPRDTIITLHTSLNDGFNKSHEIIQLYPNPFSYSTILQSKNPFKNASLTMENCLGQTVKKTDNIYGQTIIVSRDNLPGGIYFLRLSQNSRVIAVVKILITGN